MVSGPGSAIASRRNRSMPMATAKPDELNGIQRGGPGPCVRGTTARLRRRCVMNSCRRCRAIFTRPR
jgi:hypothetical protein